MYLGKTTRQSYFSLSKSFGSEPKKEVTHEEENTDREETRKEQRVESSRGLPKVEKESAEEKTIGGIIIPDTAKEKPLKGEVVAVGHGTKDEEMVLKVGDTVLYGKYAGTELDVEGTKYLIMRQSDVLAVLG